MRACVRKREGRQAQTSARGNRGGGAPLPPPARGSGPARRLSCPAHAYILHWDEMRLQYVCVCVRVYTYMLMSPVSKVYTDDTRMLVLWKWWTQSCRHTHTHTHTLSDLCPPYIRASAMVHCLLRHSVRAAVLRVPTHTRAHRRAHTHKDGKTGRQTDKHGLAHKQSAHADGTVMNGVCARARLLQSSTRCYTADLPRKS